LIKYVQGERKELDEPRMRITRLSVMSAQKFGNKEHFWDLLLYRSTWLLD